MTKALTKISPGKKSVNTVSSFAARILADWKKSTASILSMAATCSEANRKLDPKQRKKLLAKLPFSTSLFSKLVQIGNAQARLKKIASDLPPVYSIIYLVAKLTDEQLKAAQEAKQIRLSMERAAFVKWLVDNGCIKSRTSPADDEPTCPDGCLATLVPSDNWSSELSREVWAVLRQVEIKYGLKIVTPVDTYTARMNQWHERVASKLRVLLRKSVQEALLRKASTDGKPKRRRNETWPDFALRLGLNWEDELTTDGNDGDDRVREVLGLLGIADEFEELRRKAEAAIPPPEMPEGFETDETGNITPKADHQRFVDFEYDGERLLAQLMPPEPTLDELVEGISPANVSNPES